MPGDAGRISDTGKTRSGTTRRRKASSGTDSASPATKILGLQQSAGNRAVATLLQTKVAVEPAAHRHQPEADQLTSQVMRSLQWSPAHQGAIPATPAGPVPRPGDVQRQPQTAPKLKDRVKNAVEVFAHSDPAMVGRIADAWYEKKKGDAEAKEEILGGKGQRAGEASASGGVAGYALAKAEEIQLGELGKAYEVLAQAGFVAGAQLNLSGEVEAMLPLEVIANAKAALGLFGGVYAKAEGSGYIRKGEKWWDIGVGASGKVSGFAGVKGKGEVSLGFTKEDVGIEAEAEGTAMAGAEAEAEGEFVLDPRAKQVAIGGKLSAFAGAKLEGAAGGSLKLYGRKAIRTRITGKLEAGAGGSVEGKFAIKRGVLTLKLGAEGAIGIGGGSEGELEVDFKPIAVFAWRQASKAYWSAAQKKSPDKVSHLLQNPRGLVGPKLRQKLTEYAAFKKTQLARRKADNYAKIEKVQAIIDWELPRHQVAAHPNRAAVDKFLVEILKLSLKLDTEPTVEVKNGKITKLEFKKSEEEALKNRSAPMGKKTPTKDLSKIGSL